jgi:hypothetical protein
LLKEEKELKKLAEISAKAFAEFDKNQLTQEQPVV